MPPDSPQLPPKPEVALALLQTASSVYVHLDPRGEDVTVPSWFKKQPQLVLQVGLNMAVPIPDLDVGREAISCTLSFNRRPEFCRIPWAAIYGLVGEDGRGMIWPDSVPAEVAAAADGRSPMGATAKSNRPKLRLASSEDGSSSKPAKRTPVGSKERSAGSASAAESDESASQEHRPSQEPSPGQRPAGAEEPLAAEKSDPRAASKDADKSGQQRTPPPFVAATSGGRKRRRELPPYLKVVK